MLNHEVATGRRILKSAALTNRINSRKPPMVGGVLPPAENHALGNNGSQNTTGDSATTLSEGEHENATENDPRVGQDPDPIGQKPLYRH